jgi:hypothetical protein
MCVPLGHRYGRSHGGSIKTKISKAEVEEIVTNQSFDICQWIPKRCRIYRDCDVSIEEMLVVLKNETTKVSVANTIHKDYMRGYRTIVMDAPSIKAKFIFRIKK